MVICNCDCCTIRPPKAVYTIELLLSWERDQSMRSHHKVDELLPCSSNVPSVRDDSSTDDPSVMLKSSQVRFLCCSGGCSSVSRICEQHAGWRSWPGRCGWWCWAAHYGRSGFRLSAVSRRVAVAIVLRFFSRSGPMSQADRESTASSATVATGV
jgi:hypothetical protein